MSKIYMAVTVEQDKIAKYIPYKLEHEWDLHYYRSTADETERALAIIGVCK